MELAAADLEIKAAYDRGLITTASEAVELLAAREDGGRKLRPFNMTAYTGAAMRLPNFMRPVVIDLVGMKIPTQAVPIFRSHDPERIVAHSEHRRSRIDRRRHAILPQRSGRDALEDGRRDGCAVRRYLVR